MTLFRRNNDVVIALCVRWDRTTLPLRPRLHYIKHTVHWLCCSGCWFHLGSAYLHILLLEGIKYYSRVQVITHGNKIGIVIAPEPFHRYKNKRCLCNGPRLAAVSKSQRPQGAGRTVKQSRHWDRGTQDGCVEASAETAGVAAEEEDFRVFILKRAAIWKSTVGGGVLSLWKAKKTTNGN